VNVRPPWAIITSHINKIQLAARDNIIQSYKIWALIPASNLAYDINPYGEEKVWDDVVGRTQPSVTQEGRDLSVRGNPPIHLTPSRSKWQVYPASLIEGLGGTATHHQPTIRTMDKHHGAKSHPGNPPHSTKVVKQLWAYCSPVA